MKFSEVKSESWPALAQYYDTCLLPVTGLTGNETPWEAADLAGATGDWLSPLEQAFNGRTITMPAFHYSPHNELSMQTLGSVCGNLKAGGFRYVVVVCGSAGILAVPEGADLYVGPTDAEDTPNPERIRLAVTQLWRGAAAT